VEERILFGAKTYEYRVIEISALKGDRFYTILYPATPQYFEFLPSSGILLTQHLLLRKDVKKIPLLLL
jgi:hypothetical protein